MANVLKRTLMYTIGTTVVAASVSAVLYGIIRPQNVTMSVPNHEAVAVNGKYSQYLLDIIPDSILSAFANHKVFSVLLISIIFGLSIRVIKEEKAKQTVISFMSGIHSIFFTMIHFVVRSLPIGLFGFITVSVTQLKSDMNIEAMLGYFLVIVLSNVVQGVIILPSLLSIKKMEPVKTFKAMAQALSVGFFSKSSSGALPVTLDCIENNLHIDKKISRFVVPLCTTINMNGCAAFIFTTVIYMMQNNGTEISIALMLLWIMIATIAAIGNAGVPMGCFFLSTSLLSSMDVPIDLMGVILPFYGIIDMLETSLNIWSDSCVATIINKEMVT
jgi:Na+/H+-dicarboxylate symporter